MGRSVWRLGETEYAHNCDEATTCKPERRLENTVKLERKVEGLRSGCKQFRIVLTGEEAKRGRRLALCIKDI